MVGSDGRFAVFGPRGERVREGRLALEPLLPTLLAGPVDPLRWVSIDQVGGMPEPGLGSQPLRVLRLDLERGVTDTLETGRGPPTLVAALPDRPGIYWVVMPFASRTLVGAGAGMVWIGHSSTGEIRGYRGGSETPDAVAQLPTSAPAVARADRVRAREAYARRYSSEYWARHARLAEAVEPPDRMPMFDHVSVDRLGMLWVARYWPPWSESEQSWAVFSPEGEHVADVSVPARAVPDCFRRVASGCTPLGGRGGFLDVGVDYVLLTQRDELGVVRVRRHSLMRSQR